MADYLPVFADVNYTRKKLDFATRIAENREKRAQLRQMLNEYVRMEKTGKSSLEDPQTREAILNLSEQLQQVQMLTKQITEQKKSIETELSNTDARLKELSNMLQKQKESIQTGAQGSEESSIMLETRKIQLQDREKQLQEMISKKEGKLSSIEVEFEKIKKQKATLSQQKEFFTILDSWREGGQPSADPVHQTAYGLFLKAKEAYNSAESSKEAKMVETYFLAIEEAIFDGIDCLYLLVSKDLANYATIDLHVKIDHLFTKKVVVNPTLLDSLAKINDRARDGVNVTPSPSLVEEMWEYATKNLLALKIL